MSLEDLIDNKQTMKSYVVTYNADGTEGRGPIKVKAVCLKRATALRLAKGISTQGSDGDIEEVELVRQHWSWGRWFGPVDVVYPTIEDDRYQEHLDNLEVVKQKAREAGLTDEDIKLLAARE